MKKKATITILLTVLMNMVGTKTYAYDIEVANAQGVTIYYNYINDGKELAVASSSKYTGDIVIPEEVTFMGRTRKVTSIGSSAFSGCGGLTSITIPTSVTRIGSYAFQNCSKLTSVIIPNSVIYIDSYAFSRCSNLNSIMISDSATSIGSYAFQQCNSLTSITIPNNVTSIGSSAFYECSNLTSVTIDNSSTSIGNSAFQNCSSLTSVSTGNSVKSIGEYAFSGCSGLKSFTIPNSVTSIGKYAFKNCKGLTSITIPSSVKSIGECAFDGIDLQYVKSYIVKPFVINGKSTGNRVFSKNTFNNTTLYVPEGTLNLYKFTEGWEDFLYYDEIKSQATNGLYYTLDHENLTASVSYKSSYSGKIEIPNSINPFGDFGASYRVTGIGEKAFKDCTGLTSITIPNSVMFIGTNAFSGCSGLTSVHITDLEAWCKIYDDDYLDLERNPLFYAHHLFMDGEEIKDLVIPNSLTTLGCTVFAGCSGLTSVTIPNSITSISSYAFWGCTGLTSVHITDLEAWCNIEFQEYLYGMEYKIYSNPLRYAQHLYVNGEEIKDLIIPNSVTSIGSAFEYCSGLTSVTIPNSVTTINASAFQQCSSLTSVTIPNSVTRIEGAAFADCSNLTDVYCLAEEIPNTNSNIFAGSPTNTNATLHVYAVSLDNYKNSDPWKNFKNIVTIEPKCAKPTITYKNGNLRFSCATEGAEFHYSMSKNANLDGVGNEVSLAPSVTISVYAAKSGYVNSDTTTMELVPSSGMNGDLNGDGVINADDHEVLSDIIFER